MGLERLTAWLTGRALSVQVLDARRSSQVAALPSLERVTEERAKLPQFLLACYDFDTTPMPVQSLWHPAVTVGHRCLSEL